MTLRTIVSAIGEALARPAKALALALQQTDTGDGQQGGNDRAMLASIKRELADHPSRGLTPADLYQILEEAEAGQLTRQHALFADMEEKDAQIGSDLGKRKQAAAELEWQIEAPENANRAERKAADQARELFGALEVEDLVIDLGDAIGHGFVLLELPWTRDGANRAIEQPQWRPHTWFQTPPLCFDELRLRDGSGAGEALWPLGWVQHRHRAKSGYVSRLGLHRSLCWPYLFQNYALGDLGELLEILGIPARLGYYPTGASGPEKATLLAAVTQLGHAAAGIIPEGMRIEYLEAAKADGATHEVMLRWCERAKSKVILGGTLTTGEGQGGSGSYAQAKVHERGFDSLIASDARQYAATIRRDILWPLAALNFGITQPRRAPRWYLDTGEAEDYKLLSDSLPVFVDLGARIPLWWFHEKTRIPEAEDDEPVLARAQLPTPPASEPAVPDPTRDPATGLPIAKADALRAAILLANTNPPPAVAALAAQVPGTRDAVPEVDPRVLTRLAGAAQPALQAMVDQVRAMLASAGTLEEAAAMLEAAYPDLDAGPLAAALTQAGLVAHLAGRADVVDEGQGAARGA